MKPFKDIYRRYLLLQLIDKTPDLVKLGFLLNLLPFLTNLQDLINFMITCKSILNAVVKNSKLLEHCNLTKWQSNHLIVYLEYRRNKPTNLFIEKYYRNIKSIKINRCCKPTCKPCIDYAWDLFKLELSTNTCIKTISGVFVTYEEIMRWKYGVPNPDEKSNKKCEEVEHEYVCRNYWCGFVRDYACESVVTLTPDRADYFNAAIRSIDIKRDNIFLRLIIGRFAKRETDEKFLQKLNNFKNDNEKTLQKLNNIKNKKKHYQKFNKQKYNKQQKNFKRRTGGSTNYRY